jgi:hypothetical protein
LNEPSYIDVYDFDRCEGLLSNHVQIVTSKTIFGNGVVFSSNSRFLYIVDINLDF